MTCHCSKRSFEQTQARAGYDGPQRRKGGKDHTYPCNGTINLFVVFELLRGWHSVYITEMRTTLGFAGRRRLLMEEVYPDVDTTVLVIDNLSTHATACLYGCFPPEQAQRIASKLEWC